MEQIIYSTKTRRWVLADGQGEPVPVGQHVDPSGKSFTLARPFDVVTVGGEHDGVPVRIGVRYSSGREVLAHPSELGFGWRWQMWEPLP